MNKVEIRELLRQKYDFTAPDWWECQWMRQPCNRPECLLCGRIMKQRFKHQFKGEDPDTLDACLEDISDSFAETEMMLRQAAAEQGIDLDSIESLPEDQIPPNSSEHPLFKSTLAWLVDLHRFAETHGENWSSTEAGLDLLWYSNYIPPKAGRNLTNRWFISHGEQDHQLDYDYQHYVLLNCFFYVKNAFKAILAGFPPKINDLTSLYDRLLAFEEVILSI